jgi:hypothetical protein
MVNFYLLQIKLKKIKIEDVPVKYRAAVEAVRYGTKDK